MEPFPQGLMWLPVLASIPVRQSHERGRPACERADILQLSMARDVAWGRGLASACPAISEAACHFFTPVFSPWRMAIHPRCSLRVVAGWALGRCAQSHRAVKSPPRSPCSAQS